MLKIRETVSEFVGTTIATVIGWLFCLTMLAGAYGFGIWISQYFGWGGNREMFGMLSALAFIWLYEHRIAQERYERLLDLISHRNSN